MEQEFDFIKGHLLLVDKPIGWTSFDVVARLRNRMRRYAGQKVKVGHAGTLDPLASGLLILCTGKMTKQIDSYQAQEKEYLGALELGAVTPSFDGETEITERHPIDHLSEGQILSAVQPFLGEIEQVPPQYSAVRVKGKRAYEAARLGERTKLDPRQITISAFEITDIQKANVQFRVVCSKGTYIRSLVRDFGRELGVGAYMTALRRTRIGDFHVDDAPDVEQWSALIDKK